MTAMTGRGCEMGTRSLTVFKDVGTEIAVLYRQYDGYPSGHGQDLVDFLRGITITNAVEAESTANGIHCLAVQVVAHFMGQLDEAPGDFYLYPAGTRDLGEEWIYTVSVVGNSPWLAVQAGGTAYFGLPGTKQDHMPLLFEGTPDQYDGRAIERSRAGMRIPNDLVEGARQRGTATTPPR